LRRSASEEIWEGPEEGMVVVLACGDAAAAARVEEMPHRAVDRWTLRPEAEGE
jgi:hypothetical protein